MITHHWLWDTEFLVKATWSIWEFDAEDGFHLETRPAYFPEESAPDLVCLSYTHDRDFGTFKDYPKGKELFRGRGWCPPSQAEYPDCHTFA